MTNFREHQHLAKRNSARLIALFALCFVAVVFSIWYATTVIICAILKHKIVVFNPVALFNQTPIISLIIIVVSAAIIALSALSMARELKGDGNAVAKMLNAKLALSFDPSQKRLINVVEEMALASGILPPSIYVLDDDEAINALAAGESPRKAAIVVTSGALRYLTRDELQGVIAHEFSHILNEDVKINMRMVSLIFGLENIKAIGVALLRVKSSGRNGNGKAVVYGIAASMYVFGAIGGIYASIIKSAINRQREFLADASAVQFTRQIDGIGGALKKIGALGSTVSAPKAATFSYFFFARGAANLSASHPPLADRIKRVDPNWDGRFITPKPLYENKKLDETAAASNQKARIAPALILSNLAANEIAPAKGAATDKLIAAKSTIDAISTYLRDQSLDPLSARWIIYALLIDPKDKSVAARQKKIVEQRTYMEEFKKIEAALSSLKREHIVHLIFLCANALKSLTFDQYIRFREGAELLIEEDGKLSLFEFNLKYLVFYPLDIAFGLRQEPKIAYFNIASIATETSIALSAIIYDQYQEDGKAQEAFEKISEMSNVLAYIPSERILNQTLDRAYNAIQQADEGTKRRIIDWALKCVQSDKVTSAGEIETIHALRSALGLGYL